MDSSVCSSTYDDNWFDRTGGMSVGLLFSEESVVCSDVCVAVDGVVFIQQRRPSVQSRRCGAEPRWYHIRCFQYIGHYSWNPLRTIDRRIGDPISRPMVSGLCFGGFDELCGGRNLHESELCESDHLITIWSSIL